MFFLLFCVFSYICCVWSSATLIISCVKGFSWKPCTPECPCKTAAARTAHARPSADRRSGNWSRSKTVFYLLCFTVFYCIFLWFTMFSCILLYFTLVYYVLLYFTVCYYVLLYILLCFTMAYCILLWFTVFYYILLYFTMFYCILLYFTIKIL